MTEQNNKPRERIFVAIDVAKAKNDVVIELEPLRKNNVVSG